LHFVFIHLFNVCSDHFVNLYVYYNNWFVTKWLLSGRYPVKLNGHRGGATLWKSLQSPLSWLARLGQLTACCLFLPP